jgi:hypothetical protein
MFRHRRRPVANPAAGTRSRARDHGLAATGGGDPRRPARVIRACRLATRLPAILLPVALLLAVPLPANPAETGDWEAYTRRKIAAGRLRTERAPPDAPFGPDELADHFLRIAFGREGPQTPGSTERRLLRRWTEPIVYAVWGYPARPADDRAIDGYMARLSRITGHPIRRGQDVGLVIFILSREGREAAIAAHRGAGTELHGRIADFLAEEHPGSPCRAMDFTKGGVINFAVVLIEDGMPVRLRLACIEEELAQIMGLSNDDAGVRPSIFNDDQEFALLTAHDEILLRMLYDPALRPGMTRAEVLPLLPAVVARARAQHSPEDGVPPP